MWVKEPVRLTPVDGVQGGGGQNGNILKNTHYPHHELMAYREKGDRMVIS